MKGAHSGSGGGAYMVDVAVKRLAGLTLAVA